MENNITAVIIEDNLESRVYLEHIIKNELPIVSILGYATGVTSGKQLILNTKPDVVFLDILLKDGYAFDILTQIDSTEMDIIFVTGLNDYYQKAFDHFAMSYITKPYTPYDISRSIQRVLSLRERPKNRPQHSAFSNFISATDSHFLLHVGDKHINIRLAEVIMCQSDGNYTQFIMSNLKTHMASHVLKYYENLFAAKGFVRVNRKTLINIKHIKKVYKKEYITMINDQDVNLSAIYAKSFGAEVGFF